MNFKDPLLQTKYLNDLFGDSNDKANNSSIIDLSQENESSGTTSGDDDEPLSSLIKTSRKRNKNKRNKNKRNKNKDRSTLGGSKFDDEVVFVKTVPPPFCK